MPPVVVDAVDMCDHCGCRAFAPVAELTAEHEVILGLAWTLAEDPHRDSPARLAGRDGLLAILDRHVWKEEFGFYPELADTGDLSAEHTGTLEDEHRTLRASLVDATFDRRDFYALAAHIEEEEMELFPAAMLAFDEDTWDRLDALRPEATVGPMSA